MKKLYFSLILVCLLLAIVLPASAITWTSANGCWTATNGANTLVMWNSTGISSYTIPTGVSSVWYLVVAGGAGGGLASGGGGGAGGLLNGTLTVTPGALVKIGVGLGGTAGTTSAAGGNGGDSNFSSVDATGGGGGGSLTISPDGQNGGSGGGAAHTSITYGTGVGGQGNNGGKGSTLTPQYPGGGGGGAGGVGADASSYGGNGGIGLPISITGTSVYYAGGGGGGAENNYAGGNGGSGGGGQGYGSDTPGDSGTNGLGGGGGGGGYNSVKQPGGSGGTGVVIISYTVTTPPVVTITSNISSTVEPNGVIQFNDTSAWISPTLANWSWGDNTWSNVSISGFNENATHLWLTGGAYNVKLYLTNASFTNNSVSTSISVYNSTVSGFAANATSGVIPLAVMFNVTTANDNATYWNWSAGDSSAWQNGTTQNFTHTYNTAGTYTVTEISNNAYAINTTIKTNYITASNMILVSDFIPNQTMGYQYPISVTFTDNSTSAATWNYSFGDTYTSTLASPSHIYTVANNYTIQQNVTNSTGSYATSTKYVNLTSDDDIWLKSWLQFENTTVIDLKGVAWTNNGATLSTTQKRFGTQSLYVSGNNYITSPSSAVWDQSSVAGELEFWIYPTAYGASGYPLIQRATGGTATNGWGLFNINATANGYAFWYGNGATNYTKPFTLPLNTWTHVVLSRNTSQYWNVYINGNLWSSTFMDTLQVDTVNPFNIGPGTGGNSANKYSFYIDEFRYSQGVQRFSSNFSTPYAAYNGDLYQNYVNINPNATLLYKSWPGYAQAVYNITPHNRTVQIMNVTNATSISLTINFPNVYEYSGTPFINATGAAIYSDLALSNVVIDNNKGVDSFTVYRTGGGGFSSLFNNRTSLVDVPVIYYNYTTDQYFDTYFASGNITDGQHSATYPIYNFYDTLLPIGTWTIYPSITANITTTTINTPIQFTDKSFGEPTGWATYNWAFGDGGTSTSQNPVYSYSAIGNYTVTYTSTLIQNTSITNSTMMYINITASPPPAPISAFVGSPLVVSVGSSVQFTDQSSNSPSSWLWVFGDGSGNTNQNPLHTYTSVGNYTVNLTATNSQGSNTLSKTNYIRVVALTAPVAGFTSNVSTGLSPLAVQFTDTSTNIPTSWGWAFGDGNISSSENPAHAFYGFGNYTVNLTAYNAAGNSTVTHYINVVSLSGYTRQDLVMTSQYTLTINFVDSSTNMAIPVVKVVNAADGTSVNTTTGVYTGTFGYSTVVLYCYSDGYTAKSVSYVVTGNLVETVQLVASQSTTSSTTTWYTPKTVAFTLVDVYGNKLTGATMNAHYNSTTLPSGVSDLLNNYGMNANAANDALNGTLIMSGSTDSMGVVVFTMMSTIKYDITVSYGGNTNTYSFYPQEPQYQLKFIVPVATDNIWNDLYENGNTKVWATEPDTSNVTFHWSFQDMTSLTTKIDFYLKDVDLNTTVYTTNVSLPVAGNIYQLNYNVTNTRGKNYIAWENYTRNV